MKIKLNPQHILFRNMIKIYFFSIIVLVICFFVITGSIETMETLRKFSAAQYNVHWILITKLVLLKTICNISSFLPFIVFVGSLLFFLILSNRKEMISIRAIGISPIQIIKCLLTATVLIGALYITVLDYYCASATRKISKLEQYIYNQQNQSELTVTKSGIWFKDANSNNSYIIHAAGFSLEKKIFYNISFFEFTPDGNFCKSIKAPFATINENLWTIDKPVVYKLDNTSSNIPNISFQTSLSLEKINNMTTNPKNLSFWSIKKYAALMTKFGLSDLKYNIQWFIQLSSILQMIAMMLLSAAFCVNNCTSSKKNLIKALSLVTLAFPLYFINNLLIAFGTNGRIPIWMATLLLPTLTIATILQFEGIKSKN